jgi:signal transduction histidine kinase
MSSFLKIFSEEQQPHEQIIQESDPEDFEAIENEEKILQDIIDRKCEAAMVCIRKPKIANFLSIVYANKVIYELFHLQEEDIIGKNYDFFYIDADIDSQYEDQFEYGRLIKAVRDNHECSIVVSSLGRIVNAQGSDLHISFIPHNFENSQRSYGILTFIKVNKEGALAINKKTDVNSSVLQNLERNLSIERLLREVAEMVICEESISNLATNLAKIISIHLKCDRCVVFGYEQGEVKFVFEHDSGDFLPMIDKKNPDSNQRFVEFVEFHNRFCEKFNGETKISKPLIIEDVSADPSFAPISKMAESLKIKSQIVVPIFLSHKIAGGIFIHQSKKRAWAENEVKIIEVIANQFGIAIDRNNSAKNLTIANKTLIERTSALELALRHEQETRKIQNEFVTLVSHEFKTPLQVIDSTRELIARKLKASNFADETIFGNLERIKSGIQRMNGLINSNLDLAHIESDGGKMKIEITDVNFHQIFLDIVEKNLSLATQKGIEVFCRISELPKSYSCDQKMLEHILSNIVSNAIKYSKPESNVKIVAKDIADSYAIRVADDGIGIPEAELEKIGQKFFRASNSRSVSGTGIGIYLAKYFTEMLGGKFKIDSKKDVGTSVTLILPKNIKSK